VLNVNVLAGANAEAYYAEAAMSGIEDYRLGTEAPTGVWCASASLLGLSGDIARADLTAAIDDRRPHDVLRGVFSKRRAAIVEELAREGRRSAPAKFVREYVADRRPRWAAEALAAAFPTAHLTESLTKRPTKEPTKTPTSRPVRADVSARTPSVRVSSRSIRDVARAATSGSESDAVLPRDRRAHVARIHRSAFDRSADQDYRGVHRVHPEVVGLIPGDVMDQIRAGSAVQRCDGKQREGPIARQVRGRPPRST